MDNDLVRVKSHVISLIDLFAIAGNIGRATDALINVLLFIEDIEKQNKGKQNERVD